MRWIGHPNAFAYAMPDDDPFYVWSCLIVQPHFSQPTQQRTWNGYSTLKGISGNFMTIG